MREVVRFCATDGAFERDPYPTFSTLHRRNQVLFDPDLGAFFFGRHAEVDSILRDEDFTTAALESSAQPVMGGRVLAQMEGREHHLKRRLVQSVFTGRAFRDRYGTVIEDITRRLLRDCIRQRSFDLVGDFGSRYGVLVSLAILDLPADRWRDISAWHCGIAAFVTSLRMTEEVRTHGLECSRLMRAYLTEAIQARDQSDVASPLSVFFGNQDAEVVMPMSEVVALVLNVLLAATEPADKALSYLFYHLISDGGQLQRVRENRSLLTGAVRETLRLTSPVQLIPRQTRRSMTFFGQDLPAGSRVFAMVGCANRDPSVFEDASRFNIDRFLSGGARAAVMHQTTSIAFGAGMHACVGAAFAKMQLELAANIILDDFSDLGLRPDFRLTERGVYTRGPVALDLEFTPAAASGPSCAHRGS